MCVLAGMFVLLVVGALAAPTAEAQGAPPPPPPTLPTVSIAAGTSPVTEGTAASFTLTLVTAAPPGGLAVSLQVGEAAGSDFVASANEGTKSVTISAGQTTATYSVPTVDDANGEANGSVTVGIIATSAYNVVNPREASVTVDDNDEVAGLDLRVAASDVTPGTKNLSFDEAGGQQALTATVTLLGANGKPVTRSSDTIVGFSISYQDAVAADFTAIPLVSNVTIPAGRSYATKVLYITPNHDSVQEAPERFIFSANIRVDGVDFVDRVDLYLVDAGWQGPAVTFRVSPESINEGAGETAIIFTAIAARGAFERDVTLNVKHGEVYGFIYSCPRSFDRRFHTNWRYYANDGCPSLAVGPNDYRGDENWKGPRDYKLGAGLHGHPSVSMVLRAGQTIVSETYVFRPNDDKVYEGDEVVYFIPFDPWPGPGYNYPAAKLTIVENDPKTAPPGEGPGGVGAPALPGLTLSSVDNEPTRLAVSWDPVEGAAKYSVRWKTGSGNYGDPVETTGTEYTITGLSPNTNYTVDVAAVDEDYTLLAEGTTTGPFWPVTVTAVEGSTDAVDVSWEAVEGAFHYFISMDGAARIQVDSPRTSRRFTGLEPDTEYSFALEAVSAMRDGFETLAEREVKGTTNASPPEAEPAPEPPTIVVYHDPDHSGAAVRRYDTAVGLLDAASVSWAVRTVTGTGTVDRLAGVSGSVMPRFFLGDPEAEGWGPAQAKVNNGGLRWLRSKLEQLAASSPPAVPALSVADASAQESSGSMAFAVTLSAASGDSVSVDWATSDGTAVAGTDYTAASGTLTFAPGETGKTVTVALLDDAHDEGTETFTLTLSNARPAGKAMLADGAATGSISNADPLQKDWLARFGRAAAADAVAAVTARFETPRDAGSHLTVGGHRLSFDGAGAEAGLPPAPVHGPVGAAWPSWSGDPAGGESRTMSGRELLLGTSFRAVLGSGAGVQWTGWGQGASVSRFSSTGPGLSLSGETATGSMGMDYEHGRLLAGFAMTHSLGEGTAQGAGRSYAMGSTVTTMLPYARLRLSERVSAWGLAGTGTGRLTLDLDGGAAQRYGTDLSMTLAAAGLRGDLLTPDEAGGFALALKADALWVRTESEGVSAPGLGNLAGARADASRLRAVLDGSRTFALAGGRTLAPSATLGLRHDGGDAETGTGFELGAGLGYADPSRGLDMALRVHGLAAHADKGYGEWGVSGSLRLVPGGSGRGLSLSLVPTWGNAASDAERLWSARDAGELGLAEDFEPEARLEGELGYGFGLPRMPGVVTPYAGFTAAGSESRAYRTGARWRIAPDATLTLEAARSEGAAGEPPEHRIGLEAGFRW